MLLVVLHVANVQVETHLWCEFLRWFGMQWRCENSEGSTIQLGISKEGRDIKELGGCPTKHSCGSSGRKAIGELLMA